MDVNNFINYYFRWTYLSKGVLSAKSAKYISHTKWHSTKKAKKGMLHRAEDVMTVNSRVTVDKPSLFSERRYGYFIEFHYLLQVNIVKDSMILKNWHSISNTKWYMITKNKICDLTWNIEAIIDQNSTCMSDIYIFT